MCEAPACLVGAKASENGGEAANFCEYCKNAFLRREFDDLETTLRVRNGLDILNCLPFMKNYFLSHSRKM